MSTNCMIAVKSDNTCGVYVHYDGDPKHMLNILADLIREHGLNSVIKTITKDNLGWSYINPDIIDLRDAKDPKKKIVDGYGVAYTDVKGNFKHNIGSLSYSYVFDDSCVEVYKYNELLGVVDFYNPLAKEQIRIISILDWR